ncbi:hypothetical protein [Actinomadura atramentaria]|uniref:hypothetical protein n=1 Tax=Actinomadura atramentaria TaxID=1990 RepID=UPI00039DE9BB|nr:hypothetical protein [Actinomadura atramentaria]
MTRDTGKTGGDRCVGRAACDRVRDARHPDDPDLARLLAAAAAPGTPDELAGEERAAAAFRAARRARPARPPGRRSRRFGGRTARTLAVTGAVLALGGGAALAATGGHLRPDADRSAPASPAPADSVGRDRVARRTPGSPDGTAASPGPDAAATGGRTRPRPAPGTAEGPGRGHAPATPPRGGVAWSDWPDWQDWRGEPDQGRGGPPARGDQGNEDDQGDGNGQGRGRGAR